MKNKIWHIKICGKQLKFLEENLQHLTPMLKTKMGLILITLSNYKN